MITRRSPRSRQQRPELLQTMRTFSRLLSGKVVMPFDNGAALAAVANSAPAPAAIVIAILRICPPPGELIHASNDAAPRSFREPRLVLTFSFSKFGSE